MSFNCSENRFRSFAQMVNKNNTRTCWVLKCDIRKFFASVDHATMIEVLKSRIVDEDIVQLLGGVINSFSSTTPGVGLPLGNLTSQLLVNVYMNEFDQFMKHVIRAKYYLRYADDFLILSTNREWLEVILPEVRNFLLGRLGLNLHPGKVSIKTLASGVDVVGFDTHKHCYYGKYETYMYAKVVVYVGVAKGEPCRVVSAYSIDYVKEKKYKTLKRIV